VCTCVTCRVPQEDASSFYPRQDALPPYIVVQKDNEPQGVYLSFRRYEAILERLNKLENLELAQIAVARKQEIDRGEMGTTSFDDMIAEFAPELQARERADA